MRRLAILVLVAALAAVACGGDDDGSSTEATEPAAEGIEGVEGTITVFAAASLTDVFEELGPAFEEANPDATVEFSFGPSSGLVTQITEGAPADVIATAATSNMEDLVAADALDGVPTEFATNFLELAVPTGNPGDVDGLDDLADEDLVVGLCNEEVPCGRFAREA
ncbi:MAG TPA: molybdate ABC transporter substrate-binding protein, partial [Iamia sp.]|nr:molybdate ABC transporter substrate-binding protein [Iamia sp.]